MKQINVCAFLFFLTACTTTSLIRPADVLKKGEVELAGGASASYATVVPVVKGAIGITDSVEAGAHFEWYSLLGDVRWGILKSEVDGMAMAAGLTAGATREVENGAHWYEFTHDLAFCAGPTLTLGRRWGNWEVYAGGKALTPIDTSTTRKILSGRVGGRVQLTPNFLIGVEGGGSHHSKGFWTMNGYAIPEGSAYVGVKL